MPSINISQADFEAVAGAALDAQDAGKMGQAHALDRIARKINAALSVASTRKFAGALGRMFHHKALSWQDVESILKK